MAIYEHDYFIPIESKKILWRYLDLDKFISLLETKSLFFCRADKFSDPFEGSIPKREAEFRMTSEKRSSERLGTEFNEKQALENIEGTKELHKKFKQKYIINCWTINETESDAMWRLYLKDNEGVAIQTTSDRILQTIEQIPESIGISRIRYIDYDKGQWYNKSDYPHSSYNFYTPLVHKRLEFKHENEFRLIMEIPEEDDYNNYWNKQKNHKGLFIPIDIEMLIEKIFLPPTVDNETIESLKNVSESYGYKFTFEKSKLSSEPYY